MEYFAASFMMYYYSDPAENLRETLKKDTPLTYKYIESIN